MRKLIIKDNEIKLPIFLPDATFGVVRNLSSKDLLEIHIPALMMNSFHLMQRPGSTTVRALGGLHKMSDWDLPIFTDSGGFQAYSLIRSNVKFGSLSDEGLSLYPEGKNRRFQLTPEKSIQNQIKYGSDVLFCLDDCTHVDSNYEEQQTSVNRTISWALRCKNEYNKLLQNFDQQNSPKIFAVIQGGSFYELRKKCVESLLEIGFDGFGFGGWPLDSDSNLLIEVLEMVRKLVPDNYLIHALGIGHPQNIVTCYKIGYDIFDCAMPTRDARHGRLLAFTEFPDISQFKGNWFKFLYINDEKFVKSANPISPYCDCFCCKNYSIGYLHHLFKMNDGLYNRLATIHNLRFITRITEVLQNA